MKTERKWGFEFVDQSTSRLGNDLEPVQRLPPTESVRSTTSKANSSAELKLKKAWEVGTSPAKGIFMTMFMLWMAGSTVHFFSIMMTLYSCINPIKAILGTNAVFARFEDPNVSLLAPKLAFIAINLVSLFIAMYKGSNLGLLPFSESDWVSFVPTKMPIQLTGYVN
eukprot:TRINITY_DN697_c0_g1_i1.p1 TRINITY_DN697_c0_g1~~TRINITY_DN697_c0_g1_i1.p1  ORF type:complete len:183 (-),score=32.58 TRINITY_DN697_c0_g1_i1:175-675(-)